MFRPCLTYLMERRGAEGYIVAADLKLPVRIVRTLPSGYAIQFVEILSEKTLLAVRNSAPEQQAAA